MNSSSLRLLLVGLLLLAAIAPVRPVYTEGVTASISYARGDLAWEYFRTNALFSATFRLFNDSAGGPIFLTPGVNASDLPDNLLTCAGNLNVSVIPAGTWLLTPSSTVIHCSYDYIPDPVNSWPLESAVLPVTWNPKQIISCADLRQTQTEPIACPSTYIYNDTTGQPEWTSNPAPAKFNVDYRRTYQGTTYVKKEAMAGMMCNGSTSLGGTSAYAASGEAIFGQAVAASTILQPAFAVDKCKPNVEAMPSNADTTSNIKYFYFNNQGSQLPSTVTHSFNITIANPTSCTAVFVNATPSQLSDFQPQPMPPNTPYEINITVRNPNSDIFIQATDVQVNLPWSAAMSSNLPNGFNTPIAPGATQLLRINLTTPPTPPVVGPVLFTILFNSSTPLCNGVYCNSTVNFVLGNQSQDLVGLAVAPADEPLNVPFTVTAYTYNNGSLVTPRDTNTSVSLDGAMQYYLVPVGLPPTALDANGLPITSVSQTYPFMCAFPHLATFIVTADWDFKMPEDINRANNRDITIINCGRTLTCPDYT